MQRIFRIFSLFNALLIVLAVLAAHRWLSGQPDREPRPDVQAMVRFEPVQFDRAGFAPLRLAGAWRVISPEPRMGGVSALALDGDHLLALTDSGVMIRLPRPGAGRTAIFRDLPGLATEQGGGRRGVDHRCAGRGARNRQ